VAFDEVEGLLLLRSGDGGGAPAALARTSQAGPAHEPGHPPAATGDAPVAQLGVHPGRAVGAVGDLVHLADHLGQLGVGARPGGRLSL
jgi:hypothetical protein